MIEVLFWIYVASAGMCLIGIVIDLMMNGQKIRNDIELKPWTDENKNTAFFGIVMFGVMASLIPVLNTIVVITNLLIRIYKMIAKDRKDSD